MFVSADGQRFGSLFAPVLSLSVYSQSRILVDVVGSMNLPQEAAPRGKLKEEDFQISKLGNWSMSPLVPIGAA